MTGSSSVHVLHLTSSFPLQPSSISGIFIYRLVRNFPKEVTTTVLTPDSSRVVDISPGKFALKTFRYAPKRWQVLAHESGGLPAAFQRSRWNLLLVPFFFSSMLVHTLILAKKSDVIHAHWTINGVIAGLAGLLAGKPVLTSLRGEDVNRGASSWIHRGLLSLCLRLSDVVTTVSISMHRDICAEFPVWSSKVFFVPNGIDDDFFSVQPVRRKEKPVVLVLGSLLSVKRVDLVVAALCSRELANREWVLLIAGEGPEKTKLQEMARQKGVGEKIRFLGQVSPPEVASLLSRTDILVQASEREGRPNAVLEAMAAGIPVVASDIDGISELIDHGINGLLFPSGNANRLAEQLGLLFDSCQLREQLGLAGRTMLLDHNMTWTHCAGTYTATYRQLVEKKALEE